MDNKKDFISRVLSVTRALKKPAGFLLIILSMISIAVVSYYSFCNKESIYNVQNDKQQEVLGQEKIKNDDLRMAEKSCEDGTRQGYVQIRGSIVRPQWLGVAASLSVVSGNEIYSVPAEGDFCIFALRKTSILSVVRDGEYDKPIMLYALAGNKDKDVVIDAYSTALALIFQGTRYMWQGSVLEESITAFSFIQQDENTQKLSDAISDAAGFTAENVTSEDSEISVAYQQAISSIEKRRSEDISNDPDALFVVLLSPVDFYRDTESEYLITGKIDSLERISQQLLLRSDTARNLRVGNQIGIFVDAGRIPPPMEQLRSGYNDRHVRITARFDKVKGQFVAEELAVL